MYEALREIGVTDIEHIERYTMRQEGDEDVLKIYFKRKKSALFSHSIKFRHGRSKKMVLVDSGKHQYKEVSEISPFMLKVEQELERVVHRDESKEELKKLILSDIDHLEKVMQRKLEQLRQNVDRLT